MRLYRVFFISLSMLCLGIVLPAQARDVYVKDTLRVGVRAEPGTQLSPFSVVTTGMQLQVLESRSDYIKIRTDKGVEGWIKASYADTELPAALKLAALQKRYQELENKWRKQQSTLSGHAKDSVELSNQLATLKTANANLRKQLADQDERSMQSAFGYVWKILLVLIICIVGFSIGVSWHRNQAMKRLGGLRV